MSKALAPLFCAGLFLVPIAARADETYRLCGPTATGFIRVGRTTTCVTGPAAPPSPRTKRNASDSWIPDGFDKYNATTAYRFTELRSCKISGGTCQPIEIVTKKACKSLYVSAAQLDEQGNNIGYTNDSTAGIAAQQIAKMELRGRNKLEITEINCY